MLVFLVYLHKYSLDFAFLVGFGEHFGEQKALCQMLGWGKKEKGLNKFKKLQIKKLKQIRFSSLTYQNVGIRKKFFSIL